MIGFLFDFSANSSVFDAISLYWSTINIYLSDTIALLRETKNKSIFPPFDSESLNIDEFRLTLLKTFAAILLINLTLIFFAWKIYGKRICDRFMKPATNKAIEELKASVSKLKLPKEHTPRI